MPSCYLLVVAQLSALDRDSNNWSLFKLTEQIQVPHDFVPGPQTVVPFELHCYWRLSPAELGQEFQWRLVATAENQEDRFSQDFPFKSDKGRMRMRLQGISVLMEGETTLTVEWKTPESATWTRSNAIWPFTVHRRAQTPG